MTLPVAPVSSPMTSNHEAIAPKLRALLEGSPDAVLIVDRQGRIVALNHRVETLFATTTDRLLGRPVEVLLPERARAGHGVARAEYAASPTVRAMSQRSGLTGQRADGAEFPVEVSLTPIIGSADGLVMAVVHDLSARLPVEVALAASEGPAGALDAIPDAVLTTDCAGNLEFLNRAAEELTGWTRSAARGRALSDVLPLVSETSGETLASPVEVCLQSGASSGSCEAATPARPGHDARSLDLTATLMHDPAGRVTGAAVVARDVTHARLIVRQLAHQATHDPLTGLVNRREFERRVANALRGVADRQAHHVVCYLDLDGFKRVNDACGHSAGDDLLRQLSQVMRERMRSRDTLARLGGDEFGLLLEHCRRPQAERIAEQIRTGIGGHRFVVGEHTYGVGASLGIVRLRPGMSPAEALRTADALCYLAKRGGGDRVEVSPEQPAETTRREQAWAQRVLGAIQERHFQLYAQPLLPLREPNTKGPRLELLLRLDVGRSGPLSPRAFLPAARRHGLVPAVDEWVVGEAVRELEAWQAAHPSAECPVVAINLGEETVASGLAPALVQPQVAGTTVRPGALCFEISESTIVAHPSASMDLFQRLRAAGCLTTVEHCGSGMAAFTMLRRLQPDFIKIAGHIVRSAHRDPVQHALATALAEVGRALGLGIIGFQVEGTRALGDLRRMGVDYAQGYAIGRPEPLAKALATLG